MKDIPVYRFPAEHARENGELELYRASNKANTVCKEAIEKAISEHYCDNVLHREAVAQVAEQFGHERILYVLAITIGRRIGTGGSLRTTNNGQRPFPLRRTPTHGGRIGTAIWRSTATAGWLTCLPSWRGRPQGRMSASPRCSAD